MADAVAPTPVATTAVAPQIHAEHGPAFFPLFDYLRIVLAVGVFGTHAEYLSPDLGEACVQIFLALSGFLVGGILLDANVRSLPRFYFNRLTRIWIPYAVALVVLMTAAVLWQSARDPKLWEFAFYKATFVYNTFGTPQLTTAIARMPLAGTGNHFYSISVEEQFYLLAPALLVLLPRIRVPVLIALAGLNVVHHHMFASIALGVLLAISRKQFGPWFERPKAIAGIVGTLLLALGAMSWRPAFDPLLPVASVSVIALLARPGAPLPFGAVLGGMSYPLYLNHWIGLWLHKKIAALLHLGHFGGVAIGLLIALGLSLAHYLVIDRRVLALRRAWYTPRRGKLACVTSFSLVGLGMLVGLALWRWPIR